MNYKKPMTILLTILLGACSTSPTGRSQLTIFPEERLMEMGQMSFNEVKEKTKTTQSSETKSYVRCISDHILRAMGNNPSEWEVAVFADDQANAFALPGRKIGVYEGLLKVAKNQHQVAAVIGHEVAHVISLHANERLSANYAAQAGMALIQAAAGSDPQAQSNMMSILGLGVQVGILLPYGRVQESEADIVGIDLMAKAGFDPRESVKLWQNMAQSGGRKPPEFLSTHPASSTRINQLNGRMPQAMSLYQQAQQQGRKPSCSL